MLASGALHAAPVLLAEGLLWFLEAGDERSIATPKIPECPREGCSMPVSLASDVLETPDLWEASRGGRLWPSRTVQTPESEQELVQSLLWAGVNDIRLNESRFVFSLGAPRMDLAGQLVVAEAQSTPDQAATVAGSALDAKKYEGASPAVAAERSARLREMMEGLVEKEPVTVPTKGAKVVEAPPPIEETTPREAVPGATPQQDQAVTYRDEGFKETVKAFTTALISFVRSVREFFGLSSNP